jgi:hypothetical protein
VLRQGGVKQALADLSGGRGDDHSKVLKPIVERDGGPLDLEHLLRIRRIFTSPFTVFQYRPFASKAHNEYELLADANETTAPMMSLATDLL